MPTEKVISLNNLDRYDKNLKTVAGILQRSTAYVLGDVVHKKNIYLKCTTAGTTKATTLDLTNVAKGAKVTDGTVVWTVTSTTGPASGESSGAGLEDWQANHNYAQGNIFVLNNQIYKVLVAHTSGSTPDEVTKVDDTPISVWTAETEYTEGDVIEYQGTDGYKYYSVTANFTSGTEFEVTAEMSEIVFTDKYVPHPLTKAQINNLINNFVPSGSGTEPIFYNDSPIGTIISYMGITAPKDYLACDGTIYNIADYRELAEYIKRQFGSYNYFGGDGTTTFAVPDLRGEFLRGTGTNSHTNQGSGASVGTHQDATIIPGLTNTSTAHNNMLQMVNSSKWTPVSKTDYALTSSSAGLTNFTGANGGSASNGIIEYTTRPTNTSVLYCIKYNTSVLSTPENNYSTEEQRIGTWIDGKPLYQITIQNTMPTITTEGTRVHKLIDIDDLKIKKCILLTGFIDRDNEYGQESMPINSINSISSSNNYPIGIFRLASIYKSDSTKNYLNSLFIGGTRVIESEQPIYITLQYTKTTD